MCIIDAAGLHSTATGASDDVLREAGNAVWLCSKLSCSLERPVFFLDRLRMRADEWWIDGATVYRLLSVVANGEVIGKCVTTWMTADVDRRGIVRPQKLVPALSIEPPEDRGIKLRRLRLPEGAVTVGTRKIYYSDSDINGHMRSAKYVDILCDSIPELMGDRFIPELQVDFNLECRIGEEIQLETACDQGWIYLRGEGSDGRTRFLSRARLGGIDRGS